MDKRNGQKEGWTGKQQVTCVRTVALVYVAVFAVLCLSAFIACADGTYDLMNPIDTGRFFQTETHVGEFLNVWTFFGAQVTVCVDILK